MNERKMTIDKVKQIVENVLSENECDVNVVSVEPSTDGDYCTVILNGDVWLNVLKDIAEAIGDGPIVGGEDCNQINIFFRILMLTRLVLSATTTTKRTLLQPSLPT